MPRDMDYRIPSSIEDTLRRLQLSAAYEQLGMAPAKVDSYGGRVGYEFGITPEQALTLGVSGAGAKMRAPGVSQDRFDVTGLDAMYRSGADRYGVSYGPQNKMLELIYGNKADEYRMQYNPTNQLLQLLYRRAF